MSKNISPTKYFLSGGFGGVCSVLSGHPMDTIKVRLQTMPVPTPGEKPLYTGTWDCFSKTMKSEGVLGLYKGMSAPLVAAAPIFAMSFFGFGVGKTILQGDDPKPLSKQQLFAAGAFSGICTTAITSPGERIKCLLQIQQASKGPPKYKGMVDCAKQLYRQGGIESIYKGTVATFLRDVPANGVYFMTYEWIKELLVTETSSNSMKGAATIFAGGCAGTANWLMAMPADVVKSKLQTAPEGAYPNGFREVLSEVVTKEGPSALYRGLTPALIRAFPANAACFLGFELAITFLDWIAPNLW